jgi:hypothetical protein
VNVDPFLRMLESSELMASRLRTAVIVADDEAAARKTRLLAITSIALWMAAIVFGRLLPYTYHRLLADE